MEPAPPLWLLWELNGDTVYNPHHDAWYIKYSTNVLVSSVNYGKKQNAAIQTSLQPERLMGVSVHSFTYLCSPSAHCMATHWPGAGHEVVNGRLWSCPHEAHAVVGEAGRDINGHPILDLPLHSNDQKLGTESPHKNETKQVGERQR